MADLAADAVAHHDVVLAAMMLKKKQDAVRTLAAVSEWFCATIEKELSKDIAQLQKEYTGAADAVGPGGCTPLLLACMQGSTDGVAAMLALDADPAIECNVSSISGPDTKYKYTPLMLAARDGHMEIVKVLLAHERVDVNQTSSDAGSTALFYLCQTTPGSHRPARAPAAPPQSPRDHPVRRA